MAKELIEGTSNATDILLNIITSIIAQIELKTNTSTFASPTIFLEPLARYVIIVELSPISDIPLARVAAAM